MHSGSTECRDPLPQFRLLLVGGLVTLKAEEFSVGRFQSGGITNANANTLIPIPIH